MAKKTKTMAKRAAAKIPAYMQSAAFTKRSKKAETAHRARQLGTFGAASPVRRIDLTSEVL